VGHIEGLNSWHLEDLYSNIFEKLLESYAWQRITSTTLSNIYNHIYLLFPQLIVRILVRIWVSSTCPSKAIRCSGRTSSSFRVPRINPLQPPLTSPRPSHHRKNGSPAPEPLAHVQSSPQLPPLLPPESSPAAKRLGGVWHWHPENEPKRDPPIPHTPSNRHNTKIPRAG
jgi:hypothetical protein